MLKTMASAAATTTPKMPSALTFQIVAKCSTTKARASVLRLPHGPVETPLFMPVATQGSLKGLTPEQLEASGCRLCLNNTYHLGLKPGQVVLDAIGGAHKLQGWNHNILTDSGGFQMVSLLELATVTESGVEFRSPHDGSPMLLTPEHSMDLQHSIGSDIIMQLDDVIATTSTDDARMREAMHRSIRWLDRCITEHLKVPPSSTSPTATYADTQNLFCIIQGGLDLALRKECCEEMVKRDTPGIAIGGLSGGEEKEKYCQVVTTCTDLLPEGKPRYVMGVGYPEDLIVSVALGADMFDCVWGTRTARFGNAITSRGVLNLRNSRYANDFSAIDPDCTCTICSPQDSPARAPLNPTNGPASYADGSGYTDKGLGITRAFIHHLAAKETVGAHMLTMHNVAYLLKLMNNARTAVVEDRYPQFLRDTFGRWYGGDKEAFPKWAVDALKGVGVDLLA
ncbi:queuine tRNA-ribosyltransferase [Tricharina praecox]|uniref:queuine tRNA-ribosyltransferase n=1 Tax=Tricharina praecox TaxID=43433 RepID=UPI00221FC45C|nr:queuine tRNA-ribosyltransferase [Tricharina praecox]KAI5845351.1 queuine tRNA-ribosyltransferase [Tricharina praecox]